MGLVGMASFVSKKTLNDSDKLIQARKIGKRGRDYPAFSDY
jgi:hypothetical protein